MEKGLWLVADSFIYSCKEFHTFMLAYSDIHNWLNILYEIITSFYDGPIFLLCYLFTLDKPIPMSYLLEGACLFLDFKLVGGPASSAL